MARRKERSYPVTELPGYRDIVEIGGGAFATVYRALEEDTGRPVALKALKVETVHPRLLETFTREIQALAQVSNHPNIVTLYRPLITPDQRPVLVLELCQESLSQRIRRVGPLSAQDVTGIGIKIAGALETAHRHGFLHRDMKPQNILITEFEEPALSDFGVAALQASAQAFAGVFGFTTLHAAPEILEGHQLSAATDIYGLASTMYQMLSGFAPFATFENEAPASVILRIIRDPVRPLRSQDIPIGLSDLLESALSKDPDSRPHSAVEFADALVALEATSGWPATPYVVWGERSKIASASDSVSALPTMPVTEEVPIPPLRAGLTPRPPSVTMPNVGRPQPRSPAPPPPAAAPPAAPASASPPPAAAPPAAPPPAAPCVGLSSAGRCSASRSSASRSWSPVASTNVFPARPGWVGGVGEPLEHIASAAPSSSSPGGTIAVATDNHRSERRPSRPAAPGSRSRGHRVRADRTAPVLVPRGRGRRRG